ncbi:MAG: DNA double-strand break repair nuclease NurA [Candidatus Thermoplasmatota archaeon]
MLEDLYEAMDDLSATPDEWGKPSFNQDQYYEPVPLSRENLTRYDARKEERMICCVDGGNNRIYESPTDSIHLLKIYFNLFRGKRRTENFDPFTAILVSRFEDGRVSSELRPQNEVLPMEKNSYVLKEDELENGSPATSGHTIRKYVEWKALEYMASEFLNPGDILVRDGVLQTTVERERRFAEKAYQKVEENDIILTGIAKTSSLKTTSGYPLVASVQSIAREAGLERETWYYHPIAHNSHPDHKGEIFVVKYHPSSDYAFRTEFYRGSLESISEEEIEEVLGHLAFQAKDPIFLGYPYGLVDADKKARVTDEEVEYLRNMGDNRMSKTFRDKVNSSNAHDRLSEI